PRIAPAFFHRERHTPWGAAIAFEERAVRDYFIGNALHWIKDYRFDGLRLDAVDEIDDSSERHILIELAETVRSATPGRHVHLVGRDRGPLRPLHGRYRPPAAGGDRARLRLCGPLEGPDRPAAAGSASPAGQRQLPAQPRPGRQPRLRRASPAARRADAAQRH